MGSDNVGVFICPDSAVTEWCIGLFVYYQNLKLFLLEYIVN